jgi:dolichol kinase
MKSEIMRQLVHMSGLLFILLAQFMDKAMAGLLFLLIALFFLAYSEHVSRCEKNRKSLLSKIECRIRGMAFWLERKDSRKPFTGAFWFYTGIGLAFLIFPLRAASAAGVVLAVSDSLSTVIGVRFGRHRLAGKKTYEGTGAFFVSALLVCLIFFSPVISLLAATIAALAELLPETRLFSHPKLKIVSNDNILIPLMTGLSLTVLGAFI